MDLYNRFARKRIPVRQQRRGEKKKAMQRERKKDCRERIGETKRAATKRVCETHTHAHELARTHLHTEQATSLICLLEGNLYTTLFSSSLTVVGAGMPEPFTLSVGYIGFLLTL